MKYQKGDRVVVYGSSEIIRGNICYDAGDHTFASGHIGVVAYKVKADDQCIYVRWTGRCNGLSKRLQGQCLSKGAISEVHPKQCRKVKQ